MNFLKSLWLTLRNLFGPGDEFSKGYEYAWGSLLTAQTRAEEDRIREELYDLLHAHNYSSDYIAGVVEAVVEWELK